LGIQTFGIVDTNCDPNKVDFAVPANDDATKSIAIIANYITAAIAEGLAERQAEKSEESEETEDVQDRGPRFSVEDEEKDKNRRGGGGAPRGAGGAPRKRTGGPGGAPQGGGMRKPTLKK